MTEYQIGRLKTEEAVALVKKTVCEIIGLSSETPD